ncbi:MAG TPA: glycosyltransferase family 39 protein [Solirubrobacteraceae bacterium]
MRRGRRGARLAARLREPGALAWLAGLATVTAASAVLNVVKLSQNGYANIFYSAAVRSMLDSWHNFFFASFDPAGLVSVDKPPLALWVQTLSAKIFGFSPLSLLLPEALMGVAAVALLYVVIARRFGVFAGVAAGVALAVFPSFVAVSRANGVDPLLILLSLGACVAAIRACESGSWLSLLLAGALIGLAFNTKTLAAYLTVPGIALGYFVCAPVSMPRRVAQLLVAGLVAAIFSFAWIAAVEATSASKRPYVGSSTDNTELGLTFGYNGFGRVEGQNGGPGRTQSKPGAAVPKSVQLRINRRLESAEKQHQVAKRTYAPSINIGRNRRPVPFGGPPGVLRLWGRGLGEQGGWYLPFAFFGLFATLAMLGLQNRQREGRGRRAQEGAPRTALTPGALAGAEALGRRDPRLIATIVLGGWFMTEAVLLSASKGIVHPYYISAVAPGAAAMIGSGVASLVSLARRRPPLAALVLAGGAVATTVVAELVMMQREHYMKWFEPLLLGGAAVCLAGLLLAALLGRGRGAAVAVGLALAVLLVVPTGYASSTWLAPVESTFPAPGPTQTAGSGGVGLSERALDITEAMMRYVRTHGGTPRYEILTVASDAAAPFILLGMNAAAVGGYSGVDPVLGGPKLARLVARREARYVMLGGEYASRGGNRATKAVLAACREMAPAQWHSPVAYPSGLVLFDCAGRERRLAAAG